MDVISRRETVILVADSDALFPATNLYPAEDLFPDDGGVREIKNIVAGTLKLDEFICENIPQFGKLFATKFECKIYNEDDISGKVIHVYQQNEGVYSDIFVGKIDSCKLDKVGTDRTIVAYDDGYLIGQRDVAGWWTNFWNSRTTATLKQVRDSMLNYCSVNFEDVVLPNDNLQVTKTVDLSMAPMNSILKMICELNCCFPHFNRSGFMEFIMLETEPETIIDITDDYEWMHSDFEDFVTSSISGVQFFDSGMELKQTYGTSENAYPIKKNIFLYEKGAATLDAVGETMLDYLQGIHYTPASVKMILGTFDYKLGNYVHTEKGNFYIFQNSYSGSQFIEQTIKARGTEILYDSVKGFDYDEIVLNEKIGRVKQTVDSFEIEYANFKEQTNSRFEQTAESISTEVSRATDAEGRLSTQIQQTANSISFEVTNGQTSSTFKLKLGEAELSSGSITFTGFVTFSSLSTAGQTTINGSNITTGTINADLISTGTMSADRIKGGTLELGERSGHNLGKATIHNNWGYDTTIDSNGLKVSSVWGGVTINNSGIIIGNSNSGVELTYSGYSGYAKFGSTSDRTEIDNGKISCKRLLVNGSDATSIKSSYGITLEGSSSGNIVLKDYVKIGDSSNSRIGFYGTSPTSCKTVRKLSSTSSTSLSDVISKVNDLLDALDDYGLINSY